ncbi:YcdB/YcdC domain-containing protein [Brevibacillus laterosporus]|uniref:YcdB/YcdC domain-containing protein n=1 Tax=Brevibacillus laterosporus TaxID=1465 RepID=UPI003D2579DE
MNLPSEKEILHALKQREDLQPRSQFVEECEVAIIKRLAKKKRTHIWYLRTVKISCIGAAVMLVMWLGSPLRYQPLEWSQTEPIVTEPLHNKPLPSIPKPPIEKKGPTIRPTVPVPTPTPIQVPDRVPAPPLVSDRDHKPVPILDSDQVKEKISESVVDKKEVPFVEQHQMTEFEQIAFDYLKPRLGDSINNFESFVGTKGKVTGQVVYYRMVHNTPILDQNINLSISVQTKNVYSTIQGNIMEGIDPHHFPLPKDVLTKTEVEEFLEKEMRLVYLKTEANQYVLGYQPAIYGYIDAKNGEWLDSSYRQLDKSSERTILLTSTEQLSAKSEEEAQSILADLFTVNTQKISMQSSSSYKKSQKYNWVDETGKRGSMEVDWSSGQLLEYFYKPETNHTSTQINKAEAQQKAITLLEHIVPVQIKELNLDISKERTNNSSITFTFYPVYEGAPVISHPYHVTIDMNTGTITNYQGSSFDPELLPKQTNILSIKEATQAYIKTYPFQLAYILPTHNEAPSLVYTSLPVNIDRHTIDAKTGQLLKDTD